MIRIDCMKDIEEASLDYRIKYCLRRRMRVLLDVFKTDNVACSGSIFVLVGFSDFVNLPNAGIVNPPSEIAFESVTKIHILSNREECNLLLGCVVLNNDYAIDILCVEGFCNKELETNMQTCVSNEEFLILIGE